MAHDETDKKEHDELHEADPTEEVGPEKAQTSPGEAELRIHQMQERVHESEVKIVEELQEAYQPNPKLVAAEDGMPYEVDPNMDLPEAPDFTRENVVCIADDRQYVEVFSHEMKHELILTFGEEPVGHGLISRSMYETDGSRVERKVFEKSQVSGERFGVKHVSFTPVRPLRERCIHFKRQLFANDDQKDETQPGHRILFRNCAARRSVGGAALSLRDEAVFACDWREPRDVASEERFLDSFDNKLLEIYENKNNKKLPMIDDD